MPVTEFATLEVLTLPPDSTSVSVPNAQPAPPTLSSSSHLRNFLKLAAKEQSAVSGYPVFFFESLLSSSTFYLISGWTSVSAHHSWIASETNQELLARLTGLVGVKDLVHLDIDFDEMRGQLGFDSEPASKGVLMVSDGKKRMPSPVYESRFAWFPTGVEEEFDPDISASENRSKVQAGDWNEMLMMNRTDM